MEIKRAIEILDPNHREQYDSLATVQEACRMGMAALEKQKPRKAISQNVGGLRYWMCESCGSPMTIGFRFCCNCGQAVKWNA